MDVLSIATEVATELDGKWSARPGYEGSRAHALLSGPNGEQVRLVRPDHGKDKGRVAIHANFPDELRTHRQYNEPRYAITVSAEKAPQKIAQDIARRLLPDYLVGLYRARASKAKWDKAEAIKTDMVASLQSILGGRVANGDTVHVDFQREAQVSGDAVTFTWRVERGQAVEFARFIAGLTTTKGN